MKTKILFFFLLCCPILVFGQERLKILDTIDFSSSHESIFQALDELFLDYNTVKISDYNIVVEKRSKTIKESKEYYKIVVNTLINTYSFINLELDENIVSIYFKTGVITAFRNKRNVTISYIDDCGLDKIINQNP